MRTVLTPAGLVELVRIATLFPSRVDHGPYGAWLPGWWRPPLRLRWASGASHEHAFVVPLLERSIQTVRRPVALLDDPDLVDPRDRAILRLLAPWEAPDGVGFSIPDGAGEDVWPLIANRT